MSSSFGPPSLVECAIGALHPRLQRAYALTKNVGAVLAEAEELLNLDIRGRVGVEPSMLTAVSCGRHAIRIDCDNNGEFWMELNLRTLDVRGRVPDIINDAVGNPLNKLLADKQRRQDEKEERDAERWARQDEKEYWAVNPEEYAAKLAKDAAAAAKQEAEIAAALATAEARATPQPDVFGDALWALPDFTDDEDMDEDSSSDDEDDIGAVGRQSGHGLVGTFVARRVTVTQARGTGAETLGTKIFVQHTTSPSFWLEIDM